VLVVSVGVVVVDVVSVDVDVVSPDVVIVADVSVDEEADVVSVVEPLETVDVSVDDDAPPVSEVRANAPAARNPMTNSATTATAVQDFFCGPPFFASGAMSLPS
jgi:hypothetical protein